MAIFLRASASCPIAILCLSRNALLSGVALRDRERERDRTVLKGVMLFSLFRLAFRLISLIRKQINNAIIKVILKTIIISVGTEWKINS